VDELTNEFGSMGRGAPDGYANGFDSISSTLPNKSLESDVELLVPFDDSSKIKTEWTSYLGLLKIKV
jgi:hypothetical protein